MQKKIPLKFLVPAALLGALFLTSLYSYLLFHTLAELFSIVIGCTIFILAWNFRRFYSDSFLIFIGTAYLFTSAIDLVHTLAYKGMGVFQGYDANLPTQLWIAARFMQSAALLAAPLFLRRKVRIGWLLTGFSLVTAAVLLSIFVWNIFPVCYVEGVGLTTFKISSEYAINLILAAAILVMLVYRRHIDRRVLRLLIASTAMTMLGELAFTFYIDVYGISNLAGHYFKIFATFLVYKAIIETEAGTIYTDMSQLRAAQSALRASEAQAQRSLAELQSIYDYAPVGLCFIDTSLRYQAINDTLAKVNGLEASQHLGRTLREILPARFADDVEGVVRQVLETGQGVLNREISGRELSASGQPSYWLTSYHPVSGAGGGLLGVSCVIQDITGRKRVEEHTRRQNAILAGINRVFQEALACDTEEELGRVCLRVAEEVTGSKFGLIGKLNQQTGSLEDIAVSDTGWEACQMETQPRHGQKVSRNLKVQGIYGRVLREGKGFFTNDPASHRDWVGTPPGHPHLTAFLGVPLVYGGKNIGMLGLANREGGYGQEEWEAAEALAPAITEVMMKKRAEEELARTSRALQAYTEKLRISNRELEQFCFVASHDLQEPLRKIKFYGSQLERTISGDLSPDAKDYLQRMDRSTDRMQAMIHGLLELSRVNTHGGSLEPVQLTPVVQEVINDLEIRALSVGGQIILEDLPSAEVDVVQIHQLFQNLIGNALKFHKPGISPVIRISGYVSRAENSPWVTLTVEDNGIGFDQKFSERIFQPFQRLHGRSEYEGNGLGLAICQKIVERHHGKIAVSSIPGIGSKFIITLPVVQNGHSG